jgi:acetoacetate decarboxylase
MNDINSGAGEQANSLTEREVVARAYARPFASPAYTVAPDKFFDRPALTVSY